MAHEKTSFWKDIFRVAKKKDAEVAANELLASLRNNTYNNRKITSEQGYQE
ncbi:hypothetical protein NLX67_22265 [Domibacillus sp. A3M-37]|uniref:hypothetical protein n=1 Tax=Domibacillus sp. A3M-37 TaxID=2962037 RepID=UPI0020B8A208|nr:hypothetical protein [Domibacillus sp. A3M-37]MCP3765032.1 hypothetical protein [Domibacillus sp. A3M-37]